MKYKIAKKSIYYQYILICVISGMINPALDAIKSFVTMESSLCKFIQLLYLNLKIQKQQTKSKKSKQLNLEKEDGHQIVH
jgi:hypothetical protein